MMASLYNGVEGVKVEAFGMDVTANNIANVNTTGFKYSNAEFKDIFYHTVTTQSTNPAQKGIAAMSGASKLVFSQGTTVASEGEFDVALQGKGFFGVLGADGGTYYTRNGAFMRDVNGNLVDSYGNFVLGTMNPSLTGITYSDRVSELMGELNGTPITGGYTVSSNANFPIGTPASQQPLFVPNNMYMPPVVTQNVQFIGNLGAGTKTEVVTLDLDPAAATLTQNPNGTITISGSVKKEDIFSAKAGDRILISVADANGVKKNFEASLDGDLNFTSNELDVKGLDLASLNLQTLQIATEQPTANKETLESAIFNEDGSKSFVRLSLERILPAVNDTISYKVSAQIYDDEGNAVGDAVEGNLLFDETGALRENTLGAINNPKGGSINIDLGTIYDPNQVGSGFNGIYISPGKEKSVLSRHDGVAEGFFEKYQITEDGSIVAQFSNGQNSLVGKLAHYSFINEEGLSAMGDNLFAATGNSGEASFILKDGEVVNTAKFKGGFLEQSNVDLSVEFSNLIVVQRAYGANSKSITTSDEMLKQAINMKK